MRRLRRLLARQADERAMDEELRFHLEQEAADRMRRGMPPDEAWRTARADFGAVEAVKDAARDVRRGPLFDLGRDLRLVVRALRREPLFAITAAATMASGVAAAAVVMGGVNALLLRPLAIPDARDLYVWSEDWGPGAYTSTSMAEPTYPFHHFRDVADATDTVFTGIAGFAYAPFSLRTGDDARMLFGVVATADYFRVLGVRPAAGRLFSAAGDATSDAVPEAVVSYDYWQRALGGDSAAIGQTLFVNSRAVTLVGVAPPGFAGTIVGLAPDIWVPAAVYRLPPAGVPSAASPATPLSLTIFGRLPRGLTRTRAELMLSTLVAHLPADETWQRVRRVRLQAMGGLPAQARGVFEGFLGLLGATAALVLLIAAINVAGMFLARASQRGRELAVRRALGAGRWRIVRQLLAESVVIGALGAASGIVLGAWLLHLLSWRLGSLDVPVTISTSLDLRMDLRVVAVATGIAMLAGILAGLAPALGSTRVALVPALRGDALAHGVRGAARRRFVMAQLAMSLALLVAAGLFTRALQRALDVDPGFNPDGVVLGGINLAPHGYGAARGREFYAQLLARLRARPEFTSVALGRNTPLGGENNGEGVLLPGESGPHGRRIDVLKGAVSNGFFATLRLPLLGGRPFTPQDDADAPPVVLVNQTLGRRLLNDSLPLGRTIRLSGRDRKIVGVVRDGKYRSLGEAPTSYAFLPFAQDYGARMFVFARVRGSTDGAVTAMREEVARLDPNVALELPRPLSTAVDLWRLPPRLAAVMIGAFGIVGLGLAAIGVYGVLAFRVAMRTREFGVRLALGATSGRLLREVLHEGVAIAGVGTAAGLLLAAGLGRAMASFLYGVGAFDPVTFIIGAAILAVTALAAAYLPARRAARTDPIVSLRAE